MVPNNRTILIIGIMSMEELLKENGLYRQYIQTLEKQVKANAEQRHALCKEMTNINHENLQLNRRISTQPTQAMTAAVQHYQEMFKNQYQKNTAISGELTLAKAQNEELLNNSIIHQRRIQEMENCQLKLKEEVERRNGLEQQVMELKARLKSHEDLSLGLDLMQKELQKERQYAKIIKEEKEGLQCQMAHLRRDSQRIHHENQRYQQRQKKQKIEFDHLRQREAEMTSKIALLDTNLAQSITHNQEIEEQNEQLRKSLQKAKKQVQDLSMEIKQFVNEKVQQKIRKNRTENCSIKPHFEFDSAFQQLKVQIEAIKKEKKQQSPSCQEEDRTPTYKSKQNGGFDLSSPSKWRSIEGKLSLLRSTQSMSRFR